MGADGEKMGSRWGADGEQRGSRGGADGNKTWNHERMLSVVLAVLHVVLDE